MSIRTLLAAEGLDVLWDELVYSEAVMLADPLAKPFASVITALITRTEVAQAAQKAAWRAETVAQALVDHTDAVLDDEVTLFSLDLTRAESGNKQSPRFKLYFSGSPTEIVRLGLESELKKVEPWPAKLAGEPEANLQAHGPVFTAIAADGKTALASRSTAATQRSTQRVREILTLIDDVNAARLSLSAKLAQTGVDHHKLKGWADRFFRHTHRTPKEAPTK